MRAFIFAAAFLSSCASGPVGGSYSLGSGVADYESLKAATDKCHADGGEVAIKSGYDKRDLASYECRIGGPR